MFIERCFEYFDCTHEGDKKVDFLEFVVGVFNICTFNIDTLTRFAFDIFDSNNDGELALPAIERIIKEFFGDNLLEGSTGREALKNINHFTEERGGALSFESFTIYTTNHSMILLPVFRVQRKIQAKVMGLQYWYNIEKKRPDVLASKHKSVFNAKYVQTLLRKYKQGGVDEMLNYCGDPGDTLIHLYREKEQREDINVEIETSKVKHQKFRNAVDIVKKMNAEKKKRIQGVVASVSFQKLCTQNMQAAYLTPRL